MQITQNKKRVHPYVHIVFSLTHARRSRVFKYLKRAGRANFRVNLKKIVSPRRDEIVSKRDKYSRTSIIRLYG